MIRIIVSFLIIFTSIFSICFAQEENDEGPNREIEYFKKWHGKEVGNMIPNEKMKAIWDEIYSLPSEMTFNEATNNWKSLGPSSMYVLNTGARWTGRVLDLNVVNSVYPKVASASGGLWEFFNFTQLVPYCISSSLSSLAIGSFDIKPGDNSTMIIGTGEPKIRVGTGVYFTNTGGAIFTKLNFPLGDPQSVYKVRYDVQNTNVIYLAANNGFYKSIDGGATWVNHLTSGTVTDFIVHPNDNSILYASAFGSGIYRSTDYGINWTRLTTGGIPFLNIGRMSISIPKFSSNYIYASMANLDNTTLGVFRSTNSGVNWVNVTPSSTFLGKQGWYDNFISVDPVNANIVLAGGINLWRSTNGGTNWLAVTDADIHADQHCCAWKSDGSQVWVGNDGGITTSTDEGLTWNTTENILPITQYLNIDVGVSNTNFILGGSQDNGISRSTNGGGFWQQVGGGDGGGVAVDPSNSNNVYCTAGYYDTLWAFRRYRSSNAGINWTELNTGIDISTQWYHKIRTDLVAPVYLYNNSGNYVYKSINNGDTWTKLNTEAFPGTDIANINVSRYVSPGAVVYAALNPGGSEGQKLRVYDGVSWSERSSGLPSFFSVRSVKPHPTNVNVAYALMDGLAAGNKVFKTTNKGIDWTNISGNIPNVPMGDIIPHPTNDNLLYVGTEMGCYKTSNGGVNWYRWNNGMPEATIVTEMVAIDSISTRSKYYILAATYGNSIMIREISGDDPNGISTINSNVPKGFKLNQNYPNPFNPVTNINFELPAREFVNITIYDASGKEVQSLVNENLNSGVYNYSFNAVSLSTGIYFYRISAGKFTETKKMVLVK